MVGAAPLILFAALVGADGPAKARDAAAPAPGATPAAPAAAVAPAAGSVTARAEAGRLRAWHELLGSEPHVAGSDGDRRQIERLRAAFSGMGLETRVEPFWAMLPVPVRATLEIVEPDGSPPPAPDAAHDAVSPAVSPAPPVRRGVVPLTITERNLLEDPATAHPDLTWGWNAFSASGDVTAGVIYANYGTRQDFERLRSLGVECRGRIVLARYGGNFRGYKAKFAEEAGAAGLLIYTDPKDAAQGPVWPEGGWANDTCIQRGSLLTLDWPGDPLTPLRPATRDAERLSPDSIALPRIPVQPIGYAAASQIMARMEGGILADDDPWKGGMQVPYRIQGGGLRVRLAVEQERPVRESANVIGILRGAERPDEWIVVGCHHDAWGFGAADPLAGTMVLMETARIFAEQARAGHPPARTIVFAAWGAEEFGIIGSVEWVEAHLAELSERAVAYLNLDMAAMGTQAGFAASPSLRAVVLEAVKEVPVARDPEGRSVARQMTQDGAKEPAIGVLGGGSDHIGFLCLAGAPCMSIGAGGSKGTSYHSNYDTLAWYRRVVGEDYEPALMVTRLTAEVVRRLADGPLLPLGVAATGSAVAGWLDPLIARTPDVECQAALRGLRLRAEALAQAGATVDAALSSGSPDPARVNRLLMSLDRAWLDPVGLEGRPWFRSLLVASDRDSGYSAVVLPLVTEAVDSGEPARIKAACARTADALDRAMDVVSELLEAARPE